MLSFHVKFVQTDGRTDGQRNRWTMVKQYAPDLSMREHKNIYAGNQTSAELAIYFGIQDKKRSTALLHWRDWCRQHYS